MVRRLFVAAVISAGCGWNAVPARSQTMYVQFFPLTGEIRLRNNDNTPLNFVLYSIQSPNGALNGSPTVWKSITGNYDVSGNGFIDPVNNWQKLASSPTELTEGVAMGPGGFLPPGRAISLGYVWNPSLESASNLEIQVFHDDDPEIEIEVFPQLALAGDYVADRVVNQLDYDLWRRTFGSNTLLTADGNLDGVVEAADYVVWRDNLGKSIQGFSIGAGDSGGSSLAVATSVPEATSTLLLLIGSKMLFGWTTFRRRR